MDWIEMVHGPVPALGPYFSLIVLYDIMKSPVNDDSTGLHCKHGHRNCNFIT